MEKMNITEKKSNKKTFSKDPVHNTSDFQVENMKHKIESVKKKKKKMYNYKNIEQLKNIHDDVAVDSSNNTVVEGLPTNPIAQFKDDDFEGGEDGIYEPENPPSSPEAPKSDKKSEDKSVKETINDFFSNPDKFGDNVVDALIRGFSVENVQEKDKEIVKNYVYSFFSILLAFYLTINLCVTMFLRVDGKRLGIVEFDPYDKTFDTSQFAPGYPIIYRYTEQYLRKMKDEKQHLGKEAIPEFEIPYFLLSGPLFLADSFGRFVETAPDKLTNYFNTNLLCIMVFVFMFFMSRNAVEMMRQTFDSALSGDFSNPLIFMPLMGIIWVYAMSFSTIPQSRIDLLKDNTYFLIAWGITALVQFVLFLFLGPIIGALLFVIIFMFLSTISMWFYAEWNISKAFTMVRELHKMIVLEMMEYEMPANNNCRKTGFFSDILFYLNRMVHFTYNNLHYLSFIILLGVACADYYANMQSEKLKNMLIPFTIALIIGLTTLMENPFAYIFRTADSLY